MTQRRVGPSPPRRHYDIPSTTKDEDGGRRGLEGRDGRDGCWKHGDGTDGRGRTLPRKVLSCDINSRHLTCNDQVLRYSLHLVPTWHWDQRYRLHVSTLTSVTFKNKRIREANTIWLTLKCATLFGGVARGWRTGARLQAGGADGSQKADGYRRP
ncbi:hypothetical protein BCR34DRAFT_349288 [Clohesyomyces aquaticus]|uniref:Uncharacterized protein n=1 Tax=Clohesyomyces aquaticus TaxID=1231657 RepID=A0A1Y1ZJR6_9PLEO|nr:hypothetical protein BCR34DRAFT_349288 [Clohesyomyces aquaticus]